MQPRGAANRDGPGQLFAESPGRAESAQRDVDRGTRPLRVGAAHRGDWFVSATEDRGVTEAARLARAYDPAMPGTGIDVSQQGVREIPRRAWPDDRERPAPVGRVAWPSLGSS